MSGWIVYIVLLLCLPLTTSVIQNIRIGAFHGVRTIVEPDINLSYIYTEDRAGLFRSGRARLMWLLQQRPEDVEWWPSEQPQYVVYLEATLDLCGDAACGVEISWSYDQNDVVEQEWSRVIDQRSLLASGPDRFTGNARRAQWVRLRATSQDGQRILYEFDLEGLERALKWLSTVPDQKKERTSPIAQMSAQGPHWQRPAIARPPP